MSFCWCSLEHIVSRISEARSIVNNRLRGIDPLLLIIGAIGGTLFYIEVVQRLISYAFSHLRHLPVVKAKIDEKLASAKKEIHDTIHKHDTDKVFVSDIPDEGLSMNAVLELARKYEMYGKFDIYNGRVSGAVYTDCSQDHITLLEKIYSKYAYSNPLHPDVFPGVRKMEAETIRMVLNLYNAPAESSGSLTTGGTESIIMACLACRNRAIQMGVRCPVIAAILCSMRIRHVPVDENNRVNLRLMEKAIDKEVCMKELNTTMSIEEAQQDGKEKNISKDKPVDTFIQNLKKQSEKCLVTEK
ncbi:hypothetical protein DICVIV_08516 [Dictyocaulus viviparus]|uniref:Pyridoxal-dependent decarboxylase domain protein n=1 Tax=Dictyocaulus viviparus TaxID=29172 RepID=A0A0D8XNW2_DICVI|nr:hypothetical protein DICVIV_08516 [Dictyocaulus viviparus]